MNFHSSPVTYISQVHLKVCDLAQSLDFYQQIMGFQVLEFSENVIVLTADGATPLLTIEQPAKVTPKSLRTTGLYHFALLLPSRKDLGCFLQHTMKHDIPIGSSDHFVSEALYLDDPDQNGIEVYVDRSFDQWQWQSSGLHMTVDPLKTNELLQEAKGASWSSLPKDTKLGHLHLHVAHLQQAEKFYTEGLGFQVTTRYGNQAVFLSHSKYHHHLGLNTWQGVGAPLPNPTNAGMKHFTVLFPKTQAMMEAVNRLRNLGIEVVLQDQVYWTKDPAQHEIRLKV